MKQSRFLTIVRASGWYDLLVTWPFATHWTFIWLYTGLGTLAQSWGLPGAVHPLDATQIMLANLLGSVVVVWSLARLLFAAWQINAFLAGASAIVLAFTLFELAFGVLQFLQVAKSSSHQDQDQN